uniref:Coiled-coil domain containing 15 n=1 Tax=Mus musculus TaxID=10090 RepID=A0A1L1SS86_MOUSE
MPGGMAPLKKPRNPTKLPLALNPTKSKDVLAVLAERNQAIIPVGAWVEPASPNWSGIPAHAEKEGSIAMQYSDLAHLSSKRTSVFPSNLNAAVGRFRLPTSQVLGDAIEDGENQLFQQQAQAVSTA